VCTHAANPLRTLWDDGLPDSLEKIVVGPIYPALTKMMAIRRMRREFAGNNSRADKSGRLMSKRTFVAFSGASYISCSCLELVVLVILRISFHRKRSTHPLTAFCKTAPRSSSTAFHGSSFFASALATPPRQVSLTLYLIFYFVVTVCGLVER
jgi:hypothetical protein